MLISDTIVGIIIFSKLGTEYGMYLDMNEIIDIGSFISYNNGLFFVVARWIKLESPLIVIIQFLVYLYFAGIYN